jgi:hypothetical protein
MNLQLTKTAFWDVDLSTMHEDNHADFIIARVFQYGLTTDLNAVIFYYTPEQIQHAITHTRGIDKKSIALAELFTS